MNKWLITVEVISLLCLSSLSYGDIYGIKVDHKHRFELLTDDNNVNDLAYFLTAISTDKRNIWVNLKKTRPDKVISKELINTRLGNVLLYADYKLKRGLVHYSDTTEYKDITRLYRNGIVGGLNYLWATNSEITIVPKYAKVAVDGDLVVVDKLSLDVELRAGKFIRQYGDKINHPFAETLDILLKRKYILPKLVHDVNYHKDFAELRTAYKAIVLAEWYKQRFGITESMKYAESEMGMYDDLIFRKFLEQSRVYEVSYDRQKGLIEEFFVSGGVKSKNLKLSEYLAKIKIHSLDAIETVKVFLVGNGTPEWIRIMLELAGYYTHRTKDRFISVFDNIDMAKLRVLGVDFRGLEVVGTK